MNEAGAFKYFFFPKILDTCLYLHMCINLPNQF